MYLYIHIYIHIDSYIPIFIYIERDKETDRETEREKEREKKLRKLKKFSTLKLVEEAINLQNKTPTLYFLLNLDLYNNILLKHTV